MSSGRLDLRDEVLAELTTVPELLAVMSYGSPFVVSLGNDWLWETLGAIHPRQALYSQDSLLGHSFRMDPETCGAVTASSARLLEKLKKVTTTFTPLTSICISYQHYPLTTD